MKWTVAIDGQRFAWCGERRCLADLPENPAALAVAARLGQADPADRIGPHGDLLLAGIGTDCAPADMPAPSAPGPRPVPGPVRVGRRPDRTAWPVAGSPR